MIKLMQIKGKTGTKRLHVAQDGTHLVDVHTKQGLKVYRNCTQLEQAVKQFNNIKVQ